MNPTIFYRHQAALQKEAADAATLENVRERAQRAADAWANLAARSERAGPAAAQAAAEQLLARAGEDADLERIAGSPALAMSGHSHPEIER